VKNWFQAFAFKYNLYRYGAGRVQIFNIHTAKMRTEGLLASCVDIAQLAEMTSNYSVGLYSC
jgi:ATP-dependent 26S proteasome regulatory subunit